MSEHCEICEEAKIPSKVFEKLDEKANGDSIICCAKCVEAGMVIELRVGNFVCAHWPTAEAQKAKEDC